MVETAVDAIITIDAHGTVTTFNRAAAQLFGYPADAVVGRNVSMLMPHDVAARHDGYVAAHVAGGPASVIGRGREVVGVDSGGVELALHLSVGEMRVDGETAYVGILRDVRPEVRLRDQLRARDAEYRAVVEALDAGFIVQRADGSVQTANAAARRLFADHVQLADGVEWRLDDLHAVDEDGVAIAPTDMPVARTLATGLPTDRVPIGVGDPADRSWLELTTLPVELGSDRQRGVVTLVGDVTDRRRSELALRERESQLRLLAQNATDLVLRSSPQQVVQYASPAASTVLGRDPATLVGLHLDAILHPDDAAQLSSRLAMIDESPDVARFDARLRRGDGAWEWCEVVARAVRDADGRLSERQSSVRSIEDRRARDAALRRSLASYRALAEHLPDGAVLLVDDDLRVRLADGPAVRTLAASTDIVGEELAQALPPPVAAAVARGCRVALGGATDVWRERHPNGRTFDITCTPVNEGTHPTRAMVLAFDVTERAWLEDEQIALRTIADAVARDADPDDVLALVVTHVASLFGAVGAAVFRFDDARTATIVASAPNPPGSLTPDGRVALDGVNAVSGIAAGAGPSVVALYPATDEPLIASLRAMGAVGGAAAPVTIHGSTWGAIGFGGADATRLVPATGSRLSRFADLIAATIASAEAWRALAVQASTDALTGLANHRTFHEHLDAAILDTTREPAAVALVLLDVDHFKRVNDTHGHRAGDDVLATVARLLAAQARPGDVVARVGGEEFAWLMMGVDEATATSRAEAARAAIAAAIIPTVGSVTVSAGVGAQVRAARAADVYALADRALYAAKQRGRNTVVAATTQIRHDDATTSRGYEAVRALARAVDVLDDDTRQHSERVADLAVRIAAALGWSAQRILLLRDAALLHDIGKIGIPRQIIRKPGRLDADETQEMRRHAALGARIAEDALSAEQVAWIRGHHERPDGEGYPDGLARNAVTEGARVIALADAFDVMTAVGTYQPRRTVTEALAECERLAGRQFDPEMVGILRGLVAPFPDRDETN